MPIFQIASSHTSPQRQMSKIFIFPTQHLIHCRHLYHSILSPYPCSASFSIIEMMEGFPSRISAAAHLDLPCLHNKIMLHKDGPGALSIRFIQFNQVEVETLHASPIPICSIPILCLPKQLRRVLLREGLSSNTDKVRASSKTGHLTAVIKDCLGCPNQSCHRRLPK